MTRPSFSYNNLTGEILIQAYDPAVSGRLIRELSYNTATDTLLHYFWNDPSYDYQNVVVLGPEDNELRTSDDNDFIDAGGGNDNIYAVDGHNVIYGRRG